jgi:hypothetical protein
MVAVDCKTGENKCVSPPDDAPVHVLIRVKDRRPEKCILNPNVTWAHPCHFDKGGVEVPCDQFKEVIETFLQEYKNLLDAVGAVLYAVHCKEVGLRWHAIFDDPVEGYCYNVAYYNVTDNCVIL